MKIPVPVFGIRPVKCRETMKIKAWSGYEKEGLSDMGNDTVYVTENGLVISQRLSLFLSGSVDPDDTYGYGV